MPWFKSHEGCKVWYEESGAGQPLLLLHGWCMSSDVWRFQLNELSQSFHVIALDFPGHGVSDSPVDIFTLESASNVVTSLCEVFGRTDVLLCGWSLGGIVALQVALRSHGLFSGLILVSSTPKFVESDDWLYGLPLQAVDGLAIAYRRSPDKARNRFVGSMFCSDENKLQHFDEIRSIFSAIPFPRDTVATQGIEILKQTDLRHQLSEYDLPVLIINGAEDSICLPDSSEYLSRSLHAEHVIFHGYGHAPFMTGYQKFNGIIEKFARRISEHTK